MVTKNKFIAGKNRSAKFHQMVERIGEISGIDLKYIRQSGERVLNHWEERTHRELKTLFYQNSFNYLVTISKISL